MKPICDICGTRHESYQAHVFASNSKLPEIPGVASNTASNKVTASNNASNAGTEEGDRERGGDGVGRCVGAQSILDGGKGGPDGGRKQRWSRESYNAYQREYMRKRRAQKGS